MTSKKKSYFKGRHQKMVDNGFELLPAEKGVIFLFRKYSAPIIAGLVAIFGLYLASRLAPIELKIAINAENITKLEEGILRNEKTLERIENKLDNYILNER